MQASLQSFHCVPHLEPGFFATPKTATPYLTPASSPSTPVKHHPHTSVHGYAIPTICIEDLSLDIDTTLVDAELSIGFTTPDGKRGGRGGACCAPAEDACDGSFAWEDDKSLSGTPSRGFRRKSQVDSPRTPTVSNIRHHSSTNLAVGSPSILIPQTIRPPPALPGDQHSQAELCLAPSTRPELSTGSKTPDKKLGQLRRRFYAPAKDACDPSFVWLDAPLAGTHTVSERDVHGKPHGDAPRGVGTATIPKIVSNPRHHSASDLAVGSPSILVPQTIRSPPTVPDGQYPQVELYRAPGARADLFPFDNDGKHERVEDFQEESERSRFHSATRTEQGPSRPMTRPRLCRRQARADLRRAYRYPGAHDAYPSAVPTQPAACTYGRAGHVEYEITLALLHEIDRAHAGPLEAPGNREMKSGRAAKVVLGTLGSLLRSLAFCPRTVRGLLGGRRNG